MLLRLIAAGTRLPAWIADGYADYAARFGPKLRLELLEIPVTPRMKNTDLARARAEEGRRMQAAIEPGMYVVALEVGGKPLSTGMLAQWLAQRLQEGRDVALLVGGPDGLEPALSRQAGLRWSLSPLTFPHGLVRVMVAEQLYRAQSILEGHPYHRA